MSVEIDCSRSVRSGEELPADRLASFLRQHLPGAACPVEIEQFPHGHSNLR